MLETQKMHLLKRVGVVINASLVLQIYICRHACCIYISLKVNLNKEKKTLLKVMKDLVI